MKAYVANQTNVLGASLLGALRWEGHSLVSCIADADVVFDTGYGVVYRKDRGLARFVYGELLGPGDISGSTVGDWLLQYVEEGRAPSNSSSAYITDARDVAVAMIIVAERGLSGEFDVIGPCYTYEEIVDVIAGFGPGRTHVELPEIGMTFRPVEETIADAVNYVRECVNKSAKAMVA